MKYMSFDMIRNILNVIVFFSHYMITSNTNSDDIHRAPFVLRLDTSA